MPYVDIPQKIIELEDGTKEVVGPFAISSLCVTVEQFLDFQNETRHITQGEKSGGCHYFLNCINSGFSTVDRLKESAFCMTYVDAVSYCEWAGVRLPTEAEWVAASLVDDRVNDVKKGNRPTFIDGAGTLLSSRLPYYLALEGSELTSTLRDETHVILRNGPMYFRTFSWNDDYHFME